MMPKFSSGRVGRSDGGMVFSRQIETDHFGSGTGLYHSSLPPVTNFLKWFAYSPHISCFSSGAAVGWPTMNMGTGCMPHISGVPSPSGASKFWYGIPAPGLVSGPGWLAILVGGPTVVEIIHCFPTHLDLFAG